MSIRNQFTYTYKYIRAYRQNEFPPGSIYEFGGVPVDITTLPQLMLDFHARTSLESGPLTLFSGSVKKTSIATSYGIGTQPLPCLADSREKQQAYEFNSGNIDLSVLAAPPFLGSLAGANAKVKLQETDYNYQLGRWTNDTTGKLFHTDKDRFI